MIDTTIERLSDDAQRLFDVGQSVQLYSWHNVAAGYGLAVHELVRKGLWKQIGKHIATDPMESWREYGPISNAITGRIINDRRPIAVFGSQEESEMDDESKTELSVGDTVMCDDLQCEGYTPWTILAIDDRAAWIKSGEGRHAVYRSVELEDCEQLT